MKNKKEFKDATFIFKLSTKDKEKIDNYAIQQRIPSSTLIRKLILDKIDEDAKDDR